MTNQRMRDAASRPTPASAPTGSRNEPPAPFQRRVRNSARLTLDFSRDRHRQLFHALADDRAPAVTLFRGLLALALEDPKLWKAAMERGRLEIP